MPGRKGTTEEVFISFMDMNEPTPVTMRFSYIALPNITNQGDLENMITRKWTRIAVSGAIAATMLMSTFVQAQAEVAPKKEMELNINHWIVTTDVNPVIVKQTTLVPLRVMKYYMKPMELHWNNKTRR